MMFKAIVFTTLGLVSQVLAQNNSTNSSSIVYGTSSTPVYTPPATSNNFAPSPVYTPPVTSSPAAPSPMYSTPAAPVYTPPVASTPAGPSPVYTTPAASTVAPPAPYYGNMEQTPAAPSNFMYSGASAGQSQSLVATTVAFAVAVAAFF
jgi:subtilase-type serine protease